MDVKKQIWVEKPSNGSPGDKAAGCDKQGMIAVQEERHCTWSNWHVLLDLRIASKILLLQVPQK